MQKNKQLVFVSFVVNNKVHFSYSLSFSKHTNYAFKGSKFSKGCFRRDAIQEPFWSHLSILKRTIVSEYEEFVKHVYAVFMPRADRKALGGDLKREGVQLCCVNRLTMRLLAPINL